MPTLTSPKTFSQNRNFTISRQKSRKRNLWNGRDSFDVSGQHFGVCLYIFWRGKKKLCLLMQRSIQPLGSSLGCLQTSPLWSLLVERPLIRLSSLPLHAESFESYAPVGPLEGGTLSAKTYESSKGCLLSRLKATSLALVH